ncbi:lipocalin family protein [Chishuiella sp.]|uniref:lipocalin family protein n=1 Tax=Chishuiella sp. TaxID=1969467 RepID=UPI0028B029F6|nr:lipocalin family protein [Chishuiella sp.]
MKKILLLASIFAMSLTTLTSCSSDDDSNVESVNNPYKDAIIGTWKMTEVNGVKVSGLNLPQINSTYISFDKDGNYSGRGYFGTGSGTYTLSGNTIKTFIDKELYWTYTINSLENNEVSATVKDETGEINFKAVKQ